jgi:hypothetical protein
MLDLIGGENIMNELGCVCLSVSLASNCFTMYNPVKTLLRTYSGILPKGHGILVERN